MQRCSREKRPKKPRAPNSEYASKKISQKKPSSKRDLVTPHKGDSRYVKRASGGQFKESNDVGKSLKQDRAKKARTTVKSGYGDQGDQKKRSGEKSAAKR